MRQSKIMKALLVFGMSVVTATAMVGITACNNDSGSGSGTEGTGGTQQGTGHEHQYDDNWSTTGLVGDAPYTGEGLGYHWKEPVCGDTDEKGEYGEHKDENGDKKCDVCGGELEHTYASAWVNTEASGHWHIATCDHTTLKSEEGPHVDEDATKNVCDVCGYADPLPAGYTDLANKAGADVVCSNTFFAQSKKLDVATGFGSTAGMYTYADDGVDTTKNYVNVSGGKAIHVTDGANVGLIADFGGALTDKVVEGYFEFTADAMGSKWSIITFYSGDKPSDANRVFGIGTDASSKGCYTLGSKDVYYPLATDFVFSQNNDYSVYYKFDLSNGRVSVKINGTLVVDNVKVEISSISGYQIISSSSGSRHITMDNLITVTSAATVADYKAAIKSDIAVDDGLLPATLTGKDAAKTTAESAIDGADTKEACDSAYADYVTSVKNLYKDYVDAELVKYDKNYTLSGLNAEDYATAKATLNSAISGQEITVKALVESYNTFLTTLNTINDDEYYKSSSTTFTLNYLGEDGPTGTTPLTLYAEDTLTKAALDKALGLPVDKKVIAWYTSEETQDDTTIVTLGNKHDTYTDKILYAVIGDASYDLAISDISGTAVTADTAVGEFFVITNKTKSEDGNKMACVITKDEDGKDVTTATYKRQVSLTGGAATTSTNSIKFVVAEGATATVTVVAGAKSDKTVKLAVLGADGKAVNVSNLKLGDETASSFENLPKATANTVMPVTYTFTLSAGTYYLGGSGGGAYIYALNVTLEAVA